MAATDTFADPRIMDPIKVQFILDNLHGNPFTVIFLTKSGEQRMYEGILMDSDTRKENVPFQVNSGDDEGKIKSFNVCRVLYLEVV
jgi:hypothetical protein